MTEQKRDPFRTLAIVSIMFGMLIVSVAIVMYYATPAHLASPIVFGAGVTFGCGGALPYILSREARSMPDYWRDRPPPPPDLGGDQ